MNDNSRGKKRIKVDLNFKQPLIDHKIKGKSWIVKMKIGDYLEITSTESNIYQRNLQNLSFYKKLIEDLLDDTTMPPISVVYPDVNINFDIGLDPDNKFIILDGLQRTNCLMQCRDIISKGKSNGKIKTIDEFNTKYIYIEIFEKLDLKYILYKMVVLNTGQKKMDYEHQLDILSESVQDKLIENEIKFITKKDEVNGLKNDEAFKLSTITAGLVSFINRSPIPSKKNAAEFLFERFNIGFDANDEEDGLSLINDETTYYYMNWVLKDFYLALEKTYSEQNPLRKYDVFLISLFASLGYAYSKNPKRLTIKITNLMNNFKTMSDPLRLKTFDSLYSGFKTGIGNKRRKFIFETFKAYFTIEATDKLEWEDIYEDIN